MDKLISSEDEKVVLTFANGHIFEGTLSNQKYHGTNCKFNFEDGSVLKSNFENNRPSYPAVYLGINQFCSSVTKI